MKLMDIARRSRLVYCYQISLFLFLFSRTADSFFVTVIHDYRCSTTIQRHQQHPFACKQLKLIGLCLSHTQEHSHTSNSSEDQVLFARHDWNRRRVLTTTTATTWTVIHSWPQIADSSDIINVDVSAALNCLQDLPSYDPTTTVRLYLCRHGETDYNRNNIIQGARIDPPINDLGIEQAKLLGQTIYRTIPQQQSTTASTTLIVHSPLQRAKQTAEIVAEQIRHSTSKDPQTWQQQQQQQQQQQFVSLRPLKALAEVDFGSIAEGAPVQQYRNELLTLYTSWAVGNYNARMTAGGESGIEILNRISKALYTMIDMAANETNCSSLVAITHSSYLRILLGAVQDFALFSATTPQSNCGINVIDFPRPSTTTFSTNRFGGEGNTNAILIPKGEVIRVNERRHLSALRLSERQPSWNQITSSY